MDDRKWVYLDTSGGVVRYTTVGHYCEIYAGNGRWKRSWRLADHIQDGVELTSDERIRRELAAEDWAIQDNGESPPV